MTVVTMLGADTCPDPSIARYKGDLYPRQDPFRQSCLLNTHLTHQSRRTSRYVWVWSGERGLLQLLQLQQT